MTIKNYSKQCLMISAGIMVLALLLSLFGMGINVGIISGVYSANMINGYVWAFLEEKKRAKKAAKA